MPDRKQTVRLNPLYLNQPSHLYGASRTRCSCRNQKESSKKTLDKPTNHGIIITGAGEWLTRAHCGANWILRVIRSDVVVAVIAGVSCVTL